MTPASASTDTDPDAIAEAVEAVAPTDLDALDLEHAGDQLSAPFSEGGTALLSVDATDGVTFTSESDGPSGAQETTVALPDASGLSDAVVGDDGSVTYSGDQQVPSINIMVAEDAVRISTVITSATQTENFDYDFGTGAPVEIQENGGALVVAEGESSDAGSIEVILASVHAPWATDAEGVPVETYYIASGNVLTKVVKHQGQNVTYPVVADPSFDQPNILQTRVRFNRAETATLASGGWGRVIGSWTCGAMALVCAIAFGAIAYNAGVAQISSPKPSLNGGSSSSALLRYRLESGTSQ